MMPDTSLRVIARVKAKEDQIAQVREILSAVVEPTRREAGCLSYQLVENTSSPAEFVFIEEWASPAAEQAHFSTPHILGALHQLSGLLMTEPEICRYVIVK
ncbi:MAG: antibiotic biosynthesis monooxygenase [Nitrospira sp. BO4]|jgi:quinol monooxygenase YgiN|nr:antibiotic biosynthesis monooxygenase [Nitrospira sp. BO4]